MYLLQAKDSVTGDMYRWTDEARDGTGYTGPNEPTELAVVAQHPLGGGGGVATTPVTDETGAPVTGGFRQTISKKWSTASSSPFLVPLMTHAELLEALGDVSDGDTFTLLVKLDICVNQVGAEGTGYGGSSYMFAFPGEVVAGAIDLSLGVTGAPSQVLGTSLDGSMDLETNDEISLQVVGSSAQCNWAAEGTIFSTVPGQ